MNPENRCHYCRCLLHINRNPKQRYCRKVPCQKHRKNLWRQAKRAHDGDYQCNQRQANQRWQESHKNYWRHYRTTHPDYVCRNREQQRARDRTARDKGAGSFLAKSDASTERNIIKSGTYRLTPLDLNLAKSDAFTAKIDLIS